MAADRLADNLAAVRQRIAAAAARSGRPADAVQLVAVTKYVTAEVARQLFLAGCHDLGESRPQELWAKAAQLADLPIRWHQIGHLQRNKVRATLPHVCLIHSADSLRLLNEIDRQAQALERRMAVLLEVNISGDSSKHGFPPGSLADALPRIANCRHVEVRGLMGMAALEGGTDRARHDFVALRELRDRLRDACPAGIGLDELSMGMSGDYEVAIEEGATMVRVGSALFEGVPG